MDPIVILGLNYGLNISNDPVMLGVPDKYGGIYSTECVNMYITPNGRTSRREGYSLLYSCSANFISNTTPTLGVVNGYLSFITQSGYTQIRVVDQEDFMSYVQFMDYIYYSNGSVNGIIFGGEDYTWEVSEYNGPDTDKSFETVVPTGNFLAKFAGRMLIGKEDMLIVSELYDFGLYELDGGTFLFETNINMVAPMNDGVWIGTEDGMYWIDGTEPRLWRPVKKTNASPVMGTVCQLPADELNMLDIIPNGMAAIVYTNIGIVIIGDNGFYMNATKNKLDTKKDPWLFKARRGSATILGNYYIVTLEV